MMWDIITEFCKRVVLDYNAEINPKGEYSNAQMLEL